MTDIRAVNGRNKMVMPIQEFFERVLIPMLQRMPEEEKAEFRAAWLAQCDRSSLRLTQADARWLKKIKIDPEGD